MSGIESGGFFAAAESDHLGECGPGVWFGQGAAHVCLDEIGDHGCCCLGFGFVEQSGKRVDGLCEGGGALAGDTIFPFWILDSRFWIAKSNWLLHRVFVRKSHAGRRIAPMVARVCGNKPEIKNNYIGFRVAVPAPVTK